MTILMWREKRLLQYSVGMKNGAFLCGKPHQLADHYPLPVVKMSLGIDPQADAGVSSWPNNPSLKHLSIPVILPDFAGVLLVVFVLVFVQRARHGAHAPDLRSPDEAITAVYRLSCSVYPGVPSTWYFPCRQTDSTPRPITLAISGEVWLCSATAAAYKRQRRRIEYEKES